MIITATYGKKSDQRETTVICIYDKNREIYYYSVYNSININATSCILIDKVNIESVHDIFSITSDKPIRNEEDLIEEIYD